MVGCTSVPASHYTNHCVCSAKIHMEVEPQSLSHSVFEMERLQSEGVQHTECASVLHRFSWPNHLRIMYKHIFFPFLCPLNNLSQALLFVLLDI